MTYTIAELSGCFRPGWFLHPHLGVLIISRNNLYGLFDAWEQMLLSAPRAGGTRSQHFLILFMRLSCFCCMLRFIKGHACMQTLRDSCQALTHAATACLQCYTLNRKCPPALHPSPGCSLKWCCMWGGESRLGPSGVGGWRARGGGCTAVTLSSRVRRWLLVRHATYQIGGEGEVEVRASVHVGENAPGRRNMGVSGVH